MTTLLLAMNVNSVYSRVNGGCPLLLPAGFGERCLITLGTPFQSQVSCCIFKVFAKCIQDSFSIIKFYLTFGKTIYQEEFILGTMRLSCNFDHLRT